MNIVIKVILIWFICLIKHVGQYDDARPKIRSPNRGKNWYPGRITVPANLVFRLEIWGSRDNGIPPRSTPVLHVEICLHVLAILKCMNVLTQVLSRMHVLHVEICSHVMAILKSMNAFTQVLSRMHVLHVERCSHKMAILKVMNVFTQVLKGHCIEFKYYADGIHSGLTPPGNNS